MDDPMKVLSIVRECEFNFAGSNEKRLKNILEQALKKWEELDFISFATAFEIQGRMVVDVFNRIPPPGYHEGDAYLDTRSRKRLEGRYTEFMELVKYPMTGRGLWPWDMLRRETIGEAGAFPPKVILLNQPDNSVKISEKDQKELCTYGENIILDKFIRPKYDDINLEKLNTEFLNLKERQLLVEKSWRWFAVYPSVMAEEMRSMRGRNRKSVLLIYLLGTRKEFATRPHNDYGLIVGLTDEVVKRQKLSEAVDAIIFAWNMLAVSPHILEDGLKIAHLDAGRHTVHTVRTYMTVQALPTIKFLVNKYIESEPAKELILGLTDEIATLPAMMSFVSRRPLDDMDKSTDTDGLRAVDYSDYNLVEVISEFFKDELEDKRSFVTEICNQIPQNYHEKLQEQENHWINELYLRSALSEVIANIEKNGIAESIVKILLSVIENDDGEELLRIKVTNHVNSEKSSVYEYDQQTSAIHGLKSLEAFFEALGGSAYGKLDSDGTTYSTVMDYNLTRWEKGINFLIKKEETH